MLRLIIDIQNWQLESHIICTFYPAATWNTFKCIVPTFLNKNTTSFAFAINSTKMKRFYDDWAKVVVPVRNVDESQLNLTWCICPAFIGIHQIDFQAQIFNQRNGFRREWLEVRVHWKLIAVKFNKIIFFLLFCKNEILCLFKTLIKLKKILTNIFVFYIMYVSFPASCRFRISKNLQISSFSMHPTVGTRLVKV